jgi:RP/EB family microtubule-associated protein
MEGAFFVPKTEILNWLNELLKLNLTKIEQLGTAAVYCQILDIMHPGKIPLARVNFKASNEWQFINNFKVLQLGFQKCKILKHVDVEKLSKSKYQDNL